MGYPKDGSMPSATVPLCNLYLSEKEASESMECVDDVVRLRTKKRKLNINTVAMEPNVLEHQLAGRLHLCAMASSNKHLTILRGPAKVTRGPPLAFAQKKPPHPRCGILQIACPVASAHLQTT